MAQYVVTIYRTVYESAELLIKAESAKEARDIAFDQAESGDIEFEFDDTVYEIGSVDPVAD
jgi:hypothetical protein